MTRLVVAILLAPTLPLWGGQQNSPPPALNDQGTFILTFAGKEYGTEKFAIRSGGGKVQAEAEINLREQEGGGRVNYQTFSKLVLDSNLQPEMYDWRMKSPNVYSLEVNFRVSPAHSELLKQGGQKDVREFALPKNVVVLDNGVVHQYELLAARYAATPGGKQAFPAYIPQEALPGVLAVQDAGMENVDLGGHSEQLRHLVVQTDVTQVDLWVDNSGRLQRVVNATAQLEATRKP